MSESAFAQFVAPENTWIHDAIAVVDDIFGITSVDAEVNEDGKLVVDVTLDPEPAFV